MPASPADPRRFVRYPVSMAVEVSAAGHMQLCDSQDLSVGGVRLVPVMPLPRGERVRVRMRSQHVRLEVSGFATVRWTRREPPYLAGLEFDESMREEAGRLILAVVGPVRLVND